MAQLNEEFQALMGALNELVVGQRSQVFISFQQTCETTTHTNQKRDKKS